MIQLIPKKTIFMKYTYILRILFTGEISKKNYHQFVACLVCLEVAKI